MGADTCAACEEPVHIGGGIAGIWSFEQEPTGGMTLTFDDGTAYFVCFPCLDSLPDDPTRADLESIVTQDS